MRKVSAVIITHNEEKNIERCLLSLKNVADEIVIVDSFSTDKTTEIAQQYKSRCFQHPFTDFVTQKNYAIAQANHDIILSLDADEALSEELKLQILEAKKNWQYDGYQMNRLTNYCGKWIRHSGWYPDKKIRLFDKHKMKWGGSNPHETIIYNKSTKLGSLKGDLLHYTLYTIEEHISQVNKYSGMAAKYAFQKGKRSSYFSIVFSPLFKFFKSYFLQLGFLDGFYGLVICMVSSHAKFLKYSKLKELELKQRGK